LIKIASNEENISLVMLELKFWAHTPLY